MRILSVLDRHPRIAAAGPELGCVLKKAAGSARWHWLPARLPPAAPSDRSGARPARRRARLPGLFTCNIGMAVTGVTSVAGYHGAGRYNGGGYGPSPGSGLDTIRRAPGSAAELSLSFIEMEGV